MGLSTQENNATFISTFDGFFEVKLKAPQEGSVQRINKNGETINVLRFNTLIGTIKSIAYKATEKYGDFWSITVVDDKAYKLDLPVTSSSTFYLLNRLINPKFNINAPVELKVFAEVEDDVKKTVILLKQAGEMIKGVYSKDNQGNLPLMVKVKFKGKEVWDSTDRDQFIRNIVETKLVPQIKATAAPAEEAKGDGPTDNDDLPEWAQG